MKLTEKSYNLILDSLNDPKKWDNIDTEKKAIKLRESIDNAIKEIETIGTY